MEKQVKQKLKPLKFLPRVASAMIFHNHQNPFSPSRDHPHNHKRFSGPIVSNIPEDVRRKIRANYKNYNHEEEEEEEVEPISPKISCIGQIKQKKKEIKKEKIKKKRAAFLAKINSGKGTTMVPPNNMEVKKKKGPSSLRKFFRRSDSDASNSSNVASQPIVNDPDKVPSLGQMKKFASGREGFKSFDWTAQIAPVELEDQEDESEEEEEEVNIISFSAPLTVGGGCGNLDLKPRKEINLWQRRTMNPPTTLQLD